jgi:hypothetical protein
VDAATEQGKNMNMLVAAAWQKPPPLDLQALSAGVNGTRDEVVSDRRKPEADTEATTLLPASLRNLARASTRAFTDVNTAGDAQKNMARVLLSPDLGSARALSTVADVKMQNGLAALREVMADLPPESHQRMADILKDSRQQFQDALRTREGMPEASGPAPASVFSAPLNRSTGSKSDSMSAFFGELGEAIASLKSDYLGVYETAMEKNSAFYKEFLNATDLTKWMEASDKEVTLTLEKDGSVLPNLTPLQIDLSVTMRVKSGLDGHWISHTGSSIWMPDSESAIRVKVISEHKAKQLAQGAEGLGLLGELKALLKKFDPSGDGVSTLTEDENGNHVLKETPEPLTDDQRNGILVFAKDETSARKWAKDMGLPESVVSENPEPDPKEGEQWLVKLDLKPIQNMVKSLEEIVTNADAKADAKGTIRVSLKTAQFQAWKVGFEAQATEIKNTSTVLAQKMANAQSIYENLIKVLSNTINAIMEMLKAFLQN